MAQQQLRPWLACCVALLAISLWGQRHGPAAQVDWPTTGSAARRGGSIFLDRLVAWLSDVATLAMGALLALLAMSHGPQHAEGGSPQSELMASAAAPRHRSTPAPPGQELQSSASVFSAQQEQQEHQGLLGDDEASDQDDESDSDAQDMACTAPPHPFKDVLVVVAGAISSTLDSTLDGEGERTSDQSHGSSSSTASTALWQEAVDGLGVAVSSKAQVLVVGWLPAAKQPGQPSQPLVTGSVASAKQGPAAAPPASAAHQRRAAKDLFPSQDWFVQDAETGAAAMEALAGCERRGEELPDVVVLHVSVPGPLDQHQAMEVVLKLRARWSAAQLPVLVVSGPRLPAWVARRLCRAGANDHVLGAPLRRSELLSRASTQLALKRSVRLAQHAKEHLGLLADVLPPGVIAELKRQGANKEKRTLSFAVHDEVSVLFSDIRGFTSMSASWSTERIITMLHAMFSAFDALCERLGVFKVETIGDAYMIVAHGPGHASRLLHMAAAMLQAVAGMDGWEHEGRPLAIRVGLHTGPAHSGVVGTTRPRYCFFGDTINTASRMESMGFPMAVQVSEATFLAATSLATPAQPHHHGNYNARGPGSPPLMMAPERVSDTRSVASEVDEALLLAPWRPQDFLACGARAVKGKGAMRTYLLKVGHWEDAARALHIEEQLQDPPPPPCVPLAVASSLLNSTIDEDDLAAPSGGLQRASTSPIPHDLRGKERMLFQARLLRREASVAAATTAHASPVAALRRAQSAKPTLRRPASCASAMLDDATPTSDRYHAFALSSPDTEAGTPDAAALTLMNTGLNSSARWYPYGSSDASGLTNVAHGELRLPAASRAAGLDIDTALETPPPARQHPPQHQLLLSGPAVRWAQLLRQPEPEFLTGDDLLRDRRSSRGSSSSATTGPKLSTSPIVSASSGRLDPPSWPEVVVSNTTQPAPLAGPVLSIGGLPTAKSRGLAAGHLGTGDLAVAAPALQFAGNLSASISPGLAASKPPRAEPLRPQISGSRLRPPTVPTCTNPVHTSYPVLHSTSSPVPAGRPSGAGGKKGPRRMSVFVPYDAEPRWTVEAAGRSVTAAAAMGSAGAGHGGGGGGGSWRAERELLHLWESVTSLDPSCLLAPPASGGGGGSGGGGSSVGWSRRGRRDGSSLEDEPGARGKH